MCLRSHPVGGQNTTSATGANFRACYGIHDRAEDCTVVVLRRHEMTSLINPNRSGLNTPISIAPAHSIRSIVYKTRVLDDVWIAFLLPDAT